MTIAKFASCQKNNNVFVQETNYSFKNISYKENFDISVISHEQSQILQVLYSHVHTICLHMFVQKKK